ncbi:MAG: hypothetical protein HFE53_06000 [Turicibacter sp.]|uniref:hypothetical protein n=1 Tax=unclassified Turicibacter TaxID=2638206 RepID=UPI001379E63F|nr:MULTISPECIES: hypothetical protein [unclassified Turicibacter]MCI8701846.1 hypothetical protein [Turicibacter sp.]MCU7204381.1 hypothetical protein [Turicibacter sp. TA25]MCU7209578.1 hypothetical protein [Turicibacter sp. 1E2]
MILSAPAPLADYSSCGIIITIITFEISMSSTIITTLPLIATLAIPSPSSTTNASSSIRATTRGNVASLTTIAI